MATDVAEIESTETEAAESTPSLAQQRKAEIRERFINGESRSVIAKALDLKYQTVYQYTKDLESPNKGEGATVGSHQRVILEDGTPRADKIRELYATGMKRSDIVKWFKENLSMDVTYQVVFAATKTVKQETVSAEAEADAEAEDGAEDDETIEIEASDETDEEDDTLFPK